MAQSHAFASEIDLINRGISLPKRSALRRLNPIINKDDGIVRVGGRLSQSVLAINEKHSPILPKSSVLSYSHDMRMLLLYTVNQR